YFSNSTFFGIKLVFNTWSIFIMSMFGMGLRSSIFIFLFRQFFRNIPVELEESAEIDGAGVIRTFWSVMLPNARGAIITVGLFAFVWQYNDYYFAHLFRYERTMPLLTTKLAAGSGNLSAVMVTSFSHLLQDLGDEIKDDPLFFGLVTNTAALLMMLPLLFAYFFVQRWFVESIERTGLTGM
ncbi:MAG: ABC transporter permease subunit, partial [Bacilli bacterium]|nr:ABC transporter permease subunit [Bacilli bacterium]